MTRQRTWLEVAANTVAALLARKRLSAEVRCEIQCIEQALSQHAATELSGTHCHFVMRDDGEELLLEARVAAVPRIGELVTIPGPLGRELEQDTVIVTDVEWVPHMHVAVVYFDTDPEGSTPAREKVDLDKSRHVLRLIRGGKKD